MEIMKTAPKAAEPLESIPNLIRIPAAAEGIFAPSLTPNPCLRKPRCPDLDLKITTKCNSELSTKKLEVSDVATNKGSKQGQ